MFTILTESIISNAIIITLFIELIKWIIKVAIYGTILYFILALAGKKLAKQIAKEFDYKKQAEMNSLEFEYDHLAIRTSEEICKRLLIIARQRVEEKKNQAGEESSDA